MLASSTLLTLLSASLLFFAAGAVAALVFPRDHNLSNRVSHSLALGGTIVSLALSVAGLLGGSLNIVLPAILPLAGGLALGLDRLSAFFLLIIAVGVFPPALYAIGYARHYKDRQGPMAFMLNIFIPAMIL